MQITLCKPVEGLGKNFYVEVNEKNEKVTKAFKDAGWEVQEDQFGNYYSCHIYAPKGTGLFGLHTTGEKSSRIKKFKKILQGLGIEEYYERQFDFRDLL